MDTRDGFSDPAKRAFLFAAITARRRGHVTIETGHILLGILEQEGCLGAVMLKDLGIESFALQTGIDTRLPPTSYMETEVCCENSPVAFHIAKVAKEERALLRHDSIGTEHMLIALSIESPGAGCAAAILAARGLTPEKLRSKLIALIGAPE